MNRKLLVLIGSLIILLCISPVFADTGTLGGETGIYSVSYTFGGGAAGLNVSSIGLQNIENMTGFYSLYSSVNDGLVASSYPTGSVTVPLYIGNVQIGEGLFGYVHDVAGARYNLYLVTTSWNPSGYSGNQKVNFTTPDGMVLWHLNHLVMDGAGSLAGETQFGYFCNNRAVGAIACTKNGDHVISYSRTSYNFFETTGTPPITWVNISKTNAGVSYPTRIYITNAGTTTVASNTTWTSQNVNFTIFSQPVIKVCMLTPWGDWYNSSPIYMYGTMPTYNISITPTTINIGDSVTASITSTIDPLLSGVDGFSWTWSDEYGVSKNFNPAGNQSRTMEYMKQGGTWYGYDKISGTYIVNAGTTIPNPVTLSGITSSGEKTVWCNILGVDGNTYVLSTNLTVGNASAEQTGFVMIDALDWQTDALVAGANISVQNLGTLKWDNESSVAGFRKYFAAAGTRIRVEATATGYDRGVVPTYQVPGLTGYVAVRMFPTGSGSAGIDNTTLFVQVNDYTTMGPKRGVTVRVTDDGQVKSTPNSGTVSFVVQNNTAYTIVAGCPANDCISGTKTETVSGSSYIMTFYLSSLYITPTPTLLPGQTATPTPTPTTDVRTNEQKGESMVKMLYDNGEGIVMLCIFMTIMGLFGFKLGK